jgi:Na+-transporting NADH:ubiquinone oxidoreductase subunit C
LYIILYSAALTIVCGGLLALASEGLKDRQQANIELEQKQNILSCVIALKEGDDINQLYKDKVRAFVMDAKGQPIPGVSPKDINVEAEYKKPAADRRLPVYEFRNDQDTAKLEYVVFPVFGRGLWDNIWGFVALKSDFNTIQGIRFQHKAETPGLGARIAESEIQDRFKDKQIYDGDKLVSVTMMKGEGNDYSQDVHKVDGMSGATLTGKGVNNMLKDYLSSYENYIKKVKQ